MLCALPWAAPLQRPPGLWRGTGVPSSVACSYRFRPSSPRAQPCSSGTKAGKSSRLGSAASDAAASGGARCGRRSSRGLRSGCFWLRRLARPRLRDNGRVAAARRSGLADGCGIAVVDPAAPPQSRAPAEPGCFATAAILNQQRSAPWPDPRRRRASMRFGLDLRAHTSCSPMTIGYQPTHSSGARH